MVQGMYVRTDRITMSVAIADPTEEFPFSHGTLMNPAHPGTCGAETGLALKPKTIFEPTFFTHPASRHSPAGSASDRGTLLLIRRSQFWPIQPVC